MGGNQSATRAGQPTVSFSPEMEAEETSIPIPPVEPPIETDDADQAFLPQVTDFLWVNQARNAFNVTGKGMTVAVLDTGLNTGHIDFTGRVAAQVNFTPDNDGNSADATDGNGHGTNVG
ncbi:MAG: S8 family serine peptidase, partial [Caldilineaceae bacterium]|nr:S8 family serine peptidase [Caldilineaceae bacterium]